MEWRDIPGCEGLYQASSDGLIRSRDRIDARGVAWVGRTMKTQVHQKSGHHSVALSICGRVKRYGVHRLILLTFKGPCPDGMEGCHNDGNPSNNKISNLRWDSYTANQRDREAHGTANIGEMNPRSVLTIMQVKEIKALVAAGARRASTALQFSVSRQTVDRIVNGDTWAKAQAC